MVFYNFYRAVIEDMDPHDVLFPISIDGHRGVLITEAVLKSNGMRYEKRKAIISSLTTVGYNYVLSI